MIHVWVLHKWPFQESTTMDSQLTSFSLSYSIEPHVISLPLSNSFAIIQIHPSICVTLETTINKGGRASVKKCRLFHVFFTDDFRMLSNDNGLTNAVTLWWKPSLTHFNISCTSIVWQCLWRPQRHRQGQWGVWYLQRTFGAFQQRANQQQVIGQPLIAHLNAREMALTMRSLKRTLS